MDLDLASERAYPTPYANSPLLPLLIMSLMQQKNAPKTTNKFKSEYDFVIVGAGSAGSVVASRLSEIPCVNVLLLEAGKSPPYISEVPALAFNFWATDLSWGYYTEPQAYTGRALINHSVSWPSGKGLGGSSLINTLFYVRGNKKDYDGWFDQGAVGWSATDVWPYFLKLEDNREPEYLANGYHVVGGPVTIENLRYTSELKYPVLDAAQQLGYSIVDPNSFNQTGVFDVQAALRNAQRCSTAKAYLVPAENRTNLDIVKNAHVRKVLFHKNTAVGVEFDFGGKKYKVRAKREVIVSAGAINSAQLLMLSGIGPEKHLKKMRIPVVADLPVGDNLQDHYGTFMHFELDPKYASIFQKLTNTTNIQDYINNRRGVLASMGTDPLAFGPLNPILDFPEFEIFFSEAAVPSDALSFGITPEVRDQYYSKYSNSTVFTCFPQVLRPKSRGTIRLKSKDPYDPPIIDPMYFSDPDDVRPVVEGLKTCMQIVMSEPMQQIGAKPFAEPFPGCEDSFGDDSYYECLVRQIAVSLSHPLGTAKMGSPDDPTTVVDPRLRVKGINGLRVIDASIMPTEPSGNTNIPVIMVAEKASDMIKDTLNCYKKKRRNG